MDHHARPIDGLRVALEMERRGRNLYLRAQQYTDDVALQTLLGGLASDEARHYTQFSAMLDMYDVPPMGEEDQALASALAAEYFFPGGLMQVAMDGALASADAMLQEAIQAEKDSIAFYQTLIAHVEEPERQAAIRQIIQEEMGHQRTLEQKLKTLQGEDKT